jgi:hypothetical protein
MVVVACCTLTFPMSVTAADVCAMPANLRLPRSSCDGYVACERTMCTCGSGVYTNRTGVCAFGRPGCNQLQSCVKTYMRCLQTLTVTARANESNDCYSWAFLAYAEFIANEVSAETSGIVEACKWQVCVIRNATQTSVTSCPSMNGTALCDFALFTPPPTTPPGTFEPYPYAPSSAAAVPIGLVLGFAVIMVWATS